MAALRPYQSALIERIEGAYSAGARRVLAVLPTGGGKTVVFSSMIAAMAERRERVLILAHRQEIIDQISASLFRHGVAHGAIVPGARESLQPVQVASVATLARRVERWRDAFGMIVVDEAHHAVAGSWRTILGAFERARVLGVTATPERLDGRGLGDMFETMIVGPGVAELIADGHLSGFRIFAPAGAPSLARVKTKMGDYALDGLRVAMGGAVITAAVTEYRRLAAGAPAVAFCVDRSHSEDVAKAFRAAGLRAAHVDGETPAGERRDMMAALGSGGLDVLCNCGLISEGVDVPAIGAAILLRPTQSLALYLQQVGRALRLAPGKERALILDFAGNSERHGRPDDPRDWSLTSTKRDGKRRAAVRRCQACGTINRLSARVCEACAAELAQKVAHADLDVRLVDEETAALRKKLVGMPYRKRLEWAGGDEGKLAAVAAACGYKRGWVRHRLDELAGASAPAAQIPF
jgi:DNA repair protein RadD